MEQDQSVAAGVDSGSAEPGAAASSVAGFVSPAGLDPASAYAGSVVQADGVPHVIQSAVAPEGGAQGADASMYSAEHASLNGAAGQTADYQSVGATENGGAATNEAGEPVPEPSSYEEGNVGLAHWRDLLVSLLYVERVVLFLQLCFQLKRLGCGTL
jgi:pre-mRNA-processing factor 39